MSLQQAFTVSVSAAGAPTELEAMSQKLASELKAALGSEFEIVLEPATNSRGWERVVRIRRGLSAGADVTLSWEPNAERASVEISEASKLRSALIYSIVLPLCVLAAYLAYNDLSPLGWLPGRKLAAGLGGVLGLGLGWAIFSVLWKVVGGASTKASTEVVTFVRSVVQRETAVMRA